MVATAVAADSGRARSHCRRFIATSCAFGATLNDLADVDSDRSNDRIETTVGERNTHPRRCRAARRCSGRCRGGYPVRAASTDDPAGEHRRHRAGLGIRLPPSRAPGTRTSRSRRAGVSPTSCSLSRWFSGPKASAPVHPSHCSQPVFWHTRTSGTNTAIDSPESGPSSCVSATRRCHGSHWRLVWPGSSGAASFKHPIWWLVPAVLSATSLAVLVAGGHHRGVWLASRTALVITGVLIGVGRRCLGTLNAPTVRTVALVASLRPSRIQQFNRRL